MAGNGGVASTAPESAPQIIYRAFGYSVGGREDGAVCRICGGPLLLPDKPANTVSNSWTDENMCRRLDSYRICRACAWFTEGKNRIGIWQAKAVLWVSGSVVAHVDVANLGTLLSQPFEFPAVVLLRGRNPNLPRKHLQWRALDAVTYDRRRARVLFYGLQLWKDGGQFTGVAQFDSDEMAAAIAGLVEQGREFAGLWCSSMRKAPTPWMTQNQMFSEYLRCSDRLTMEHILASYVASFVVAGEVAPGKEVEEVAEG